MRSIDFTDVSTDISVDVDSVQVHSTAVTANLRIHNTSSDSVWVLAADHPTVVPDSTGEVALITFVVWPVDPNISYYVDPSHAVSELQPGASVSHGLNVEYPLRDGSPTSDGSNSSGASTAALDGIIQARACVGFIPAASMPDGMPFIASDTYSQTTVGAQTVSDRAVFDAQRIACSEPFALRG